MIISRRICGTIFIKKLHKCRLIAGFSSKNSEDKEKELKEKNPDALKKLKNLLEEMIKEEPDVRKTGINLAKPKRQMKKAVELNEGEKVIEAAKNVASQFGENSAKIESELLAKLLNPLSKEEQKPKSISDLIAGMTVEKEISRAQQVRQVLPQSSLKKPSTTLRKTIDFERIDLFGSTPLGIFTKPSNDTATEHVSELKMWSKLLNRKLKLAITHPPANYFQQMILWTEQGKIWKFPIDNEQGMEAEQSVPFTEHVFLEKHLEPWCPSKGPIRHFMELVCVGLSKNPYLSAEHKKDHILWFRDYFEDKKKVLVEVGAIPAEEKSKLAA